MAEPKSKPRKGLSPQAETVMRTLAKTRVLTAAMIADLVGVSTSRARDLVSELKAWELVDSVARRQIGGESVWFLSARGVAQLELVSDKRLVAPTADQAAGILQSHTLGVNEACVAMVRGARDAGDECGPLHWDLEVSMRYAENRDGWLRADAMLSYVRILDPETFKMRPRKYAIELDRSNEPTDVLREKLRNYALALDFVKPGDEQPLWRTKYPAFPRILIVLAGSGGDNAAQLNRRLQMALRLSLADPIVRAAATRLRVSLCRLDELTADGSAGPVFWPLDVELAEAEQLRPMSLADIDDLWSARDAQQRDAAAPTPAPAVAAAPAPPTQQELPVAEQPAGVDAREALGGGLHDDPPPLTFGEPSHAR